MSNHDIFTPKGAVYVSARAWNAYQMWRDYDPGESVRDLGYAELIGLNSLRLWLSYEYWQQDSGAAFSAFDHFLESAQARGITVVPSLFEGNGPDPTAERLTSTDFGSSFCLASPASETVLNPELWDGPRNFVAAFMERYASDERLLAIELINEPENYGKYDAGMQRAQRAALRLAGMTFTREMLKLAARMRSSVPLTVGSGPIQMNGAYADIGLEIWQFHHNFPRSVDDMQQSLDEARLLQETTGRPVWISEWQRIRDRSGWRGERMPADQLGPDLASLAPLVAESGIGSFFWSLMIKPAYLSGQRTAGTFNGLFHEDGAVFSLADARAVSGNTALQLPQRPEWPEWIRDTAARFLGTD